VLLGLKVHKVVEDLKEPKGRKVRKEEQVLKVIEDHKVPKVFKVP
jgi:hypothetical protein